MNHVLIVDDERPLVSLAEETLAELGYEGVGFDSSVAALAAFHELRSEAAKGSAGAAACLKASGQLIGVLQKSAAEWAAWRPASVAIDDARVEALIAERNAARKAKDFKESDRIRDELAAQGIVLKDSKDGTTWEVRR